MLTRALIVLLLVLNVGVAAWWASRPAAAPRAQVRQPIGVERLQLLRESPHRIATANPPAATVEEDAPLPETPGAARPAQAARCFAFGPFQDSQADMLAAAQTLLRPGVASMRVRETQAGSSRGWHVFLPPLADRASAQATAERIAAAGFKDYYVVPDGTVANGIELGRYGSEAAASRRRDTLQAGGFAANSEPLGESHRQRWIDVMAATGFDPEVMRARIRVAQADPLDCTTLR